MAAWLAESMVTWSAPFDLAPFNIMQGMGSVYIPNTPWMNPGALVLSLPLDLSTRYYLSYLIYLAELTGATVILCRVLGHSLVRSFAVAGVLILVLFPPFSAWFKTLPWISLAPFNAHIIAALNGALALFHLLGRGSTRQKLLCVVGVSIVAASAIFSAPMTLLTFLLPYALFAAVLLLHMPTSASLAWKVVVVVVLLAALLLLGFPAFYLTTAKVTVAALQTPPVTAASLFEAPRLLLDQLGIFPWCDYPQEYLCTMYPIGGFHWLAVLGAVAAVIFGRGLERKMAAAMLVLLAALHTYPLLHAAGLAGKLGRIPPRFFVFASYTFYAYFAVALGATLLRGMAFFIALVQLPGLRSATLGRAAATIVVVCVLPLGGLLMLLSMQDLRVWAFRATRLVPPSAIESPVDNDVMRALRASASIKPNSVFNGYTATYFGSGAGPLRRLMEDANSDPYVQSRFYTAAIYGNSFMMTDLWSADIPTLHEYGQWITKPLYVFSKELFGNNGYGREINVFVPNLKALKTVGVKFIITDARLEGPEARLLAHVRKQPGSSLARPGLAAFSTASAATLQAADIPIFLYELNGANLGTYSPVTPIVGRAAADIVKALKSPNFEGSRDVVLDPEEVVPQLVPADAAELKILRGGVSLKARSQGSSLLVLPLQYSRCLNIEPRSPRGSTPRLLRVNLVQTGVLF